MQHAFAELTHDAIYKATRRVSPGLLREVAKSMALIETTDGIFAQVSMSLRNASRRIDDAIAKLSSAYARIVGVTPETDPLANRFILDALQEMWRDGDLDDLERYVDDQLPVLSRWVAEKAPISFLFRQPTIILLYYLASKARIDLRRQWPLTDRELDPVYADLGFS
jgi:hypothetical protein